MFTTRRIPSFSDALPIFCADEAVPVNAGPLKFILASSPRLRSTLCFASVSRSVGGGGVRNPLSDLTRSVTNFLDCENDGSSTAKPKPKQRRLREVKIEGDGRCMFRALAKGLAYNQGLYLTGEDEVVDADELRMAVYEALCTSQEKRAPFRKHVDLIPAATGMDYEQYCRNLRQANFWGGNLELMVLSQFLKVPVMIYVPQEGGSPPHRRIEQHGLQYMKKRRPVKLLYSNGNHYDLLLPA